MKGGRKKNDSGAEELPAGGFFSQLLLQWNETENDRQMPWKGEKDPYKIWLSEIILQQTRVEQGLKYYQNFINAFPSIDALATADDEQVFKLWEGLGYYSRCRNLIVTARHIAFDLRGVFPATYDEILSLKGVGPYTAAAIGSFAYNLPNAVLDGNVFRVLSRIYDIAIPIDTTEGKKEFTKLAYKTMDAEHAGTYNQAIMDFGAIICKPLPLCSTCFYSRHCLAFLHDRQNSLPVKEKQQKVRERWFYYFILNDGDTYAVRQRTEKDIWQQLYEFPLIESDQPLSDKKATKKFQAIYGRKIKKFSSICQSNQRLSHQLIHFSFFETSVTKANGNGLLWLPVDEIKKRAFPRTLKEFIDQHLIL